MTTAREQGRKQARKKQFLPETPSPANETLLTRLVDNSADAASDVWEPIAFQCFLLLDTVPPSTKDFDYQARRICKMLREALGE